MKMEVPGQRVVFLSSLKDNILVKVTITLINISSKSDYHCIKISRLKKFSPTNKKLELKLKRLK